MNLNPEIIILVGLPGSGKSTYALDLTCSIKYSRYNIHSTDAWIEAVAAGQNKTYSEVFKDQIEAATKWFKESLLQLVEEKQNIIIDRTNTTINTRKSLLDTLPKEYYKTCIYFDIPFELIQTRLIKRVLETKKDIPLYVVLGMKEKLQEPSFNEGFDKIIKITENVNQRSKEKFK